MKLSAAYVFPALYCGGAERWGITLAEHTRERIDWRGCAVTLRVDLADSPDSLVADMRRLIPVYGHGADAVDRVADADVLITWGVTRLEERTARYRETRRGPIVFVAHGCGDFDRHAMRHSARAATHWTAVSAGCLPAFRREVPGAAVTVIENGIDPARCRITRDRQAVRRELGLAPHEFAVGHVGRLSPEKNPLGLARAVACLPEHYRAVWIGGGYDAERQQERITRVLPRAIFRPRVDAGIGDYLNALDAFCLVSPAEGCSLTVLEAALTGTPMIVTPVGAMPSIEARYGRHWLTVPVEHRPEDLAREILRVARWSPQQRAAITGEARRIVEQHYQARHMADRWCAYLERIVAEWKGTAA